MCATCNVLLKGLFFFLYKGVGERCGQSRKTFNCAVPKMNATAFVLPSPIGPWRRAEWDPSGMALSRLELQGNKDEGLDGIRATRKECQCIPFSEALHLLWSLSEL